MPAPVANRPLRRGPGATGQGPRLALLTALLLVTGAALAAFHTAPALAQPGPGNPVPAAGETPDAADVSNPEDNPLALGDDERLIDLTLDRARQMALQDNYTLLQARLQPRIAAANRSLAEAQFDWILNADTTYSRSKDQSSSIFPQGPVVIEFDNDTHVEGWSNTIGVQRYFDTGTTATLSWIYNKTERRTFDDLTVNDRTGFELAVTQNLLRDFGTGPNNYSVEVAALEERAEESRVLQQQQELLFSVEESFWQLVFAHEDLDVTANSAALARSDYDIAVRKRQAGLATDIDVVAAESRLRLRERDLYQRRKSVRDASDALLTLIAPQRLLELINPPSASGDDGGSLVVFRPTGYESSEVDPPDNLDARALIQQALTFREELRQADLAEDSARLAVDYYRNQHLPDLRALAGFNFGGKGQTPGRAFDSFGQTELTEWFLGLEFSMPLGNIQGAANLEKAEQQRRSAEFDRRLAEVAVITDVLAAVREIRTTHQTLGTSRTSLSLAERQLDAAEERLRRGLATRFEVDTYKNELDIAQRDLLSAWIDLRIARARLRAAVGTLGQDQ